MLMLVLDDSDAERYVAEASLDGLRSVCERASEGDAEAVLSCENVLEDDELCTVLDGFAERVADALRVDSDDIDFDVD